MAAGYRTKVVIPEDRVIVLHLPEDMPVGIAVVTVSAEEPVAAPPSEALELDQEDIEWWDQP